ncbi:transmembrane protein 170B [Patella vulgata]|uniref:transmembrane protein 170B n=1 Tax=Patella vulgata TaxID=6465 RepID=UPI002180149C|nr:transmembrane protein 170B [Patella vulgata]
MWYQVFLWALFSSMFVHIIAALIAFCRLRKHKIGAAVAGLYRAADFEMMPFYALVWGVGQSIIVSFVSFTRILATL